MWLAEPLNSSGKPKTDRHNPDQALRTRPLMGLRILWDMAPQPDGQTWKGGKVYNPESGKTYQGRMKLEGDVIKLRAFVGMPIFGRTSRWTRVQEP